MDPIVSFRLFLLPHFCSDTVNLLPSGTMSPNEMLPLTSALVVVSYPSHTKVAKAALIVSFVASNQFQLEVTVQEESRLSEQLKC